MSRMCRVEPLLGIALRMPPDIGDEAVERGLAGHGHIGRSSEGEGFERPETRGPASTVFAPLETATAPAHSTLGHPNRGAANTQVKTMITTVQRARDSYPGRREIPPQRVFKTKCEHAFHLRNRRSRWSAYRGWVAPER